MTSAVLDQLWSIIQARKQDLPQGSYTADLFRKGENEIVKKVGEEAVEVVVAAKGEGDDRIVYESADLIYHLLVLLAAKNLTWQDVEGELARRFVSA
jgi:phosphoribosyl-ATP pyrophosphohydrolase